MAGDSVLLQIKVKDDGTIALKRVTKNVKDLEKQSATSTKGMQQSFGKLFAQIASGIAVFEAFRRAASTIGNFQKAMANASTIVDTSTIRMADMSAELLDLDAGLGSAQSKAEALYQALSAGVEPAKAVQFVGQAAMFAKAGLTTTFEAVDVLTSVLNAYGKSAEEAGWASDVLFKTIELGKTTGAELAQNLGRIMPIAAQMNISLETVSAAVATLTKGGFSTAEAVVSIGQAMVSILNPSMQAREAIDRLNEGHADVLEFSRKGIEDRGGFIKWLAILKQRVGGNVEQFGELFGNVRALRGILGLAGKQAEEFATIFGKLQKPLGAVRTAYQKQAETAAAQINKLLNKIGIEVIKRGTGFAEGLASFLKTSGEVIVGFINEVLDNVGMIAGMIGDVLRVVLPVVAALAKAFMLVLNPALKLISEGVKIVADAFDAVIEVIKAAPVPLGIIAGSIGAVSLAFTLAAGKVTLFTAAVGVAALTLKGTMTAAVTAATSKMLLFGGGFAALGLGVLAGKLVDEWTGWSESIASAAVELEKINKIGLANVTKHSRDSAIAIEEVRKATDDLVKDSTNKRLKLRIQAIVGNKEAFDKLSDSTKAFVMQQSKGLAALDKEREKRKAVIKQKEKEKQVNEDVLKTIAKLNKEYGVGAEGIEDLTVQAKSATSVFFANRKAFEENHAKATKLKGKVDELVNSFDGLQDAPEPLLQVRDALDEILHIEEKMIEVPKIKVRTELEGKFQIPIEIDENQSIINLNKNIDLMQGVSEENPVDLNFEHRISQEMADMLAKVGIILKNTKIEVPITDPFKEVANSARNLGQDLKDLGIISDGATKAFDVLANGIEAFGKAGDDLIGTLSKVAAGIDVVRGAGQALGIVSEKLNVALAGAKDGVGAFSDFIQGNMVGAITKGISAVVKLGTALFGMGKSGELEATERRLQGLTGVSEDWTKELEELAKELGGADSAGRAFNEMLDDIIRDTQITEDNFSSFVVKIREVVSTFEQGSASAAETAANFGAAFQALIESTEGAAMLGGEEITGLILLAEEFGLEVKEISEFINQTIDAGFEEYKKFKEAIDSSDVEDEIRKLTQSMQDMKAGSDEMRKAQEELTALQDKLKETTDIQNIFGNTTIGVFEDMLAFENRVAENQQLVTAVESWGQSMIKFTDVNRITQDQFDGFAESAVNGFNQLIAQGFTSTEALKIMGPQLQRLAFLESEFGHQVDEATRGLINQGIESGDVTTDMRSQQEIMNDGIREMTDGIWELVRVMGGNLPAAVDGATNSFVSGAGRMRGAISDVGQSVGEVVDAVGVMEDKIVEADKTWVKATVGNTIKTANEQVRDSVQEIIDKVITFGGMAPALDSEYTDRLVHINEQFAKMPESFDVSKIRANMLAGARAATQLSKSLNVGDIKLGILEVQGEIKKLQGSADKYTEATGKLNELERLAATTEGEKQLSKINKQIEKQRGIVSGLQGDWDKYIGQQEKLDVLQHNLQDTERAAKLFGEATIDAFQPMKDFIEREESNKVLLESISNWGTQMKAFGDSTKFTQEQFTAFEDMIKKQADTLKEQGFTEQDILSLMGDQLSVLQQQQEKWNLAIDGTTKGMINSAASMGFVAEGVKEIAGQNDPLLFSLERLEAHLKGKLPKNLEDLRNKYLGMGESISAVNQDFKDQLTILQQGMDAAIAMGDEDKYKELSATFDMVQQQMKANTEANQAAFGEFQAMINDEFVATLDKLGLTIQDLPGLDVEGDFDILHPLEQQLGGVSEKLTEGKDELTEFSDTFVDEFDRMQRSGTDPLLRDLDNIIARFNALDRLDVGSGDSSIPGFAHGGSMTIGGHGGPDSELLVARVSPGERVDFTPRGQQGGNTTVNNRGGDTINVSMNFSGQLPSNPREFGRMIRAAIENNDGGSTDAIRVVAKRAK